MLTLAAGSCRVEDIMGLPVAIDVREETAPDGAVDAAFAWLRWVDATFSTYRADSEIARLNRGELDIGDADPRVREVLAACRALRERTGGAFDAEAAAAAPGARERAGCGEGRAGAVDPAGYVKGWAAARAAALLAQRGVRNVLVDAGGDIVACGRPAAHARWRVGVEHPRQLDRVAAVVELCDQAIATSGTARRGAHIVDPVGGGTPDGVLSVSCIGRDLAVADALATAAFAMGPAGAQWLAVQPDVEAMVILADDSVLLTPGFDVLRVAPE
jgi:thiamine biosynthesis lipoprotein